MTDDSPEPIRTSYRDYEILLLCLQPDLETDIRIQVADAYNKAIKGTRNLLIERCRQRAHPGDHTHVADITVTPDCRRNSRTCVIPSLHFIEWLRESGVSDKHPKWLEDALKYSEVRNADPERGGRPLYCYEHFDFDAETGVADNLFAAFGKVDHIAVQPVPHLIWASEIRRCFAIQPWVSTIMGLPTGRLRIGSRRMEWKGDRETFPYVLFTFVKLVEKGQPSTARLMSLRGVVKVLRDRVASESSYIQAYLTLSRSYPLLCEARFRSISDLRSFLRDLRKESAYVSQTASILATPQSGGTLLASTPPDDKDGRARVILLVKLRAGHDAHAAGEIKRVLVDSGIVDPNIEYWQALDYWDLGFQVRVQKGGLVGALAQIAMIVRLRPRVLRAVTLPLLDDEPDTGAPESDRQSLTPNPFPTGSKPIPQLLSAYRYSHVREAADTPSFFANRAYDTMFEIGWLISQNRLLQESWRSAQQAIRGGHYVGGLGTFLHIERELAEHTASVEELSRVWTALSLAREADGLHRRTHDWFVRIEQELLWPELADIIDVVRHIEQALCQIGAELNHRLEAEQIVTGIGNPLKVGEPDGVLDMVPKAVERLFGEYLPPVRGSDSVRQNELMWSGITLATTGDDFSLQPVLQMLFVPRALRFNLWSRMVLVAHEAAHFAHYVLTSMGGDVTTEFASACGHLPSEPCPEYDLREEILCDLMALLAAGPAFYQALYRYGMPEPVPPRRTDTQRPSDLVERLRCGAAVMRELRWTWDDGFQARWDKSTFAANDWERLSRRIPGAKGKPRFDDEALRTYAITPFEKLRTWLSTRIPESLFYPHDDKLTLSERANIVDWVNRYCERVAGRILYNDEVVTDVPLKYIAAASSLRMCARPAYPVLRFVHSLYFANGRSSHTKFLEEMQSACFPGSTRSFAWESAMA